MKEICGDISSTYRPGLGTKVRYLTGNFVRGVAGYRTRIPSSLLKLPHTAATSESVGRQYVNGFLKFELPKLITPRPMAVLDVGCGSGYIRTVLADIGYSGRYVGVDVVREAKYEATETSTFDSEFKMSKIESFQLDEVFDLVISNTALEHVEDDAAAVEKCKQLTRSTGLQVHIVPAFWSLFAYLLHGYRQYNPERISKLFKGQRYVVWRMGGFASFVLQVLWCTIPERLTGSNRMRRMRVYRTLVRVARSLDRFLPFCALLYVVVVHVTHEK